jgi:hypothetical protein
MMQQRDRKPLTTREMRALYYAAQSGLSKTRSVGTLQRAMAKLNFQMMEVRRAEILAKGKRDARTGRQTDPTHEGRRLGSMESMTYYDGYAAIDKTFENPYRRRN